MNNFQKVLLYVLGVAVLLALSTNFILAKQISKQSDRITVLEAQIEEADWTALNWVDFDSRLASVESDFVANLILINRLEEQMDKVTYEIYGEWDNAEHYGVEDAISRLDYLHDDIDLYNDNLSWTYIRLSDVIRVICEHHPETIPRICLKFPLKDF